MKKLFMLFALFMLTVPNPVFANIDDSYLCLREKTANSSPLRIELYVQDDDQNDIEPRRFQLKVYKFYGSDLTEEKIVDQMVSSQELPDGNVVMSNRSGSIKVRISYTGKEASLFLNRRNYNNFECGEYDIPGL